MAFDKVRRRGNGNSGKLSRRSNIKHLLTYSAAVLFGVFSCLVVNLNNSSENKSDSLQLKSVQCPDALKFWTVCIWNWNRNGNMRTMNRAFERLGYVMTNASLGEDWDVLWSSEYPNPSKKLFEPLFKMPLKTHQRINHFPGINFITAKSFMTTRNRNIKYVLPGFEFPRMIDEFKAYVKKNPRARFVEKSIENRGVKLVEKHEIKYDRSNKFYQRFMEKPFLVNERFMDFSIFALISSIDPLRVYRFETDVYLRFCPEPYYPLDPKNRDKYVISDSRLEFLHFPEMKSLSENYGSSFKLIMEDHFRKLGHNVTELFRKIDDAISSLVLNNEHHLVRETLKIFNSSHHFFELVRVDFILNEQLEPHITEVNMSPGMVPQTPLAENLAPLFEQLIHDTAKLIGAGSKLDLMAGYDSLASQMMSNTKNIAVNVAHCVDNNCSQNCNKTECELCTPCLEESNIKAMRRAYREHVGRGGFKRIFPSVAHFNEKSISKMTLRNQISTKWFKSKCQENPEWC